MAELIQLRRGDAAEWAAVNPVLAEGEPGVEIDTGRQKIGDGATAWNALPYAGGSSAAEVEFTPTGGLAATDVQGALAELDGEKAPSGHTHTAAQVGAIPTTEKAAANGVATLGGDGKVPATQLPAASGGSSALDDLTDVDTTTTAPTNGQALVFDGPGGVWKPGTIAGGGTGDPSWTTVVSLFNGWTNYGGGFATAAYRKDGDGFVHLRGVLSSGTIGTNAFQLPAGYRPAATSLHAGGTTGTTPGRVDVLNTGMVQLRGGSGAAVSVDGVVFLAEQ